MCFSENATVFRHDDDPAKIAAARARGEDVVVLPPFPRVGDTITAVVEAGPKVYVFSRFWHFVIRKDD